MIAFFCFLVAPLFHWEEPATTGFVESFARAMIGLPTPDPIL